MGLRKIGSEPASVAAGNQVASVVVSVIFRAGVRAGQHRALAVTVDRVARGQLHARPDVKLVARFGGGRIR